MDLQLITSNRQGKARRVTQNGREYAVVPMVMLQEQVLAGSKGPLFYSRDEIAKAVQAWNGMPITVNHPLLNGLHVSARDPRIKARQTIGEVYNAHMDGHRLRAEGWIDLEDAKRVDRRVYDALMADRPVEVSTGLFTSNIYNAGQHNGRSYDYHANDHVPDHLAVLPDAAGACFLPGQLIEGRIIKASKARYAGEAVRIRTLSGRSLAVTANHPVLTAMGFVPAGHLAEGQDLLHYIGEDKATFADGHEKNAPALAEDVFETFKRLFGVKKRVRASSLDFHGDATFFQGEVEIISSQGALWNDCVSKPAKGFAQGSFCGRRNTEPQLSSSGYSEQYLDRMGSANVASVGSSSEQLALLGGQLGVHQSRSFGGGPGQSTLTQPLANRSNAGTSRFADGGCAISSQVSLDSGLNHFVGEHLLGNPALPNAGVLGSGAELDVSLPELIADRVRVRTRSQNNVVNRLAGQVVTDPTVDHLFGDSPAQDWLSSALDNDAPGDDQLSDRRAAEAELFCKLIKRFPAKVATDKVVSVDRFFHDGSVYDFETSTGFIVAEKLIVSNCSVQDGCGLNVNQSQPTGDPQCPT